MKVLAVSLLRLGDILMLSPVLKGIKSQHKNVELHVLINSQFSFVKTLMPWVDKFILFDRKQMQKGMGEVDRQLFEPLDRLSTTIDYLNNEKYTKVFNLTHTRLSGILCGLINAEEKLGLAFNDNHTASFGSRWYSYLNEQVGGGSDFTAHMTDVHYYGAEIPYNSHEFDFVLDKKGEDEAVALIGDLKNIICVQAFTSDNKKNWGLDRIAKSLKLFQYMNPKYSIFALGAPNESHKVSELIKVCDKEGVSVKPAICSLQGALGILRVSELLLTGDTSIKHLACGTDCKIIEIAIGSSDYRKTGVTLELKQAAPGRSVNVTVKEDQEVVSGKIKEFVDGMNDVLKFIQTQNRLDANTDTTRTLGGEGMLRSVENRIRGLVQGMQVGVSGSIKRLNQLGIVFNRNGTLDFDQDKFNTVLSRDPQAVQSFFAGDGFSTGFVPSLKNQIKVMMDPTLGSIPLRKKSLQDQITRIDTNIERKDKQLAKKETTLRRKFAKMEEAMSRLKSQANSLGAIASAGIPNLGGVKVNGS